MDHDRRSMKRTLAMTCTRPDAKISQVQRDTLVNAPLPSCTLVQGRPLRALPWTVFDDDDRASLVDAHRQDAAARKLEAQRQNVARALAESDARSEGVCQPPHNRSQYTSRKDSSIRTSGPVMIIRMVVNDRP